MVNQSTWYGTVEGTVQRDKTLHTVIQTSDRLQILHGSNDENLEDNLIDHYIVVLNTNPGCNLREKVASRRR